MAARPVRSVTTTLTMEVPAAPGVRLMVAVRFEPEPPNRMFVASRKFGLEENAVRTSESAELSASPTLNETSAGSEVG